MESDRWVEPGPLDDLLSEYGPRAVPAIKRWILQHLELAVWAKTLGSWELYQMEPWERVARGSEIPSGQQTWQRVARYHRNTDLAVHRVIVTVWRLDLGEIGIGRNGWHYSIAHPTEGSHREGPFQSHREAMLDAQGKLEAMGWVFDPTLPPEAP